MERLESSDEDTLVARKGLLTSVKRTKHTTDWIMALLVMASILPLTSGLPSKGHSQGIPHTGLYDDDIGVHDHRTLREASSSQAALHKYAVVVDGGSTGSKVFVYRWSSTWGRLQIRDSESRASTRHHHETIINRPAVPYIHQHLYVKVKPGLATLRHNHTLVENHILHVLQLAEDAVPTNIHNQTPFYYLGAAGLRELLEDNANDLIDQVDAILSSRENPFVYQSRNCRVLSGEEEGVFAWITVNYATGFFHNRVSETVGVLEKGGASSQIVFQPEGDIMADKFPVKVGGEIYPLYAHSYLYYGSNLFHRFVRERIVLASPGQTVYDDPCWPTGYVANTMILEMNLTFRGSGQPDKCLEWLNQLVYKAEPYRCHPKPCAIGTVYQPSFPESKQFYALGNYIHPARTMGIIRKDGMFIPGKLAEAAVEFCSKDRATIEADLDRKGPFLADDCSLGLFVPLLLNKGYGFSNQTTNIRAITDLNDVDMSWALGALIYEEERREWSCTVVSSAVSSSGRSLHLPVSGSALILMFTLLTVTRFIAVTHGES